MRVDFFNFSYAHEEIQTEWKNAISDQISEGTFVGGSSVREFEKEFANRIGASFAVGLSNGLDGLELGMRALNIGKGDSVAVPAHTFIASWNAILACGATPIGVDVGEDAQMDLDLLSEILSKTQVSCVMPVHMHGHVTDMMRIVDLKSKYGFKIIEDASQAHFASRDNIRVGTTSDVSVFSLYPTKNLGAIGDAGVLVTQDSAIDGRVRKLANYGANPETKYLHTELGFNRRLDSIQAAILNVNLRFVDSWNSSRLKLSRMYVEAFDSLGIPYLKGRPGSVWHHFCIFVEHRDELRRFLGANGIGTEIHYPRLAANEVSDFLGMQYGEYPIGNKIAESILSLPLSQFHTQDMIEYVIQNLQQAHINGII